MASVIDDILSERRIAFVGVAKNSGKTTAMNFALRQADQRGVVVGILSIGLDGERSDALLGTPKPPIRVFKNQYVVTSASSLKSATAEFEPATKLGFDTPLGETVCAKVTQDGEVILSGVRHRGDLKIAIDSLELCDHIFIDGAYGRVMAAHAETCDGVVVSTGAVVSNNPSVIAEKTSALVERLMLPKAQGWRRDLILRAIEEDRSMLGGPETDGILLPAKSALIGLPKARRQWTKEICGAAVLGVFSDRVAQELLWRRSSGFAVAIDSTSIQLDDARLKKFRKGWTLEVLHSTKVLAISINPTSVQGYRVRGDLIAQMISINTPKTPVFDAHSDLE